MPRKNRIKVTPSTGNVFRDLGFPAEEAEHLLIRADLLLQLQKAVAARRLTQAAVAKVLRITQPRVSDLLRGELVKTSRLVDSFLEMALTCGRDEQYLETVDINALERDRERFHQRAESQKVPQAEREIAQKNYAVILKRLEKLRDIRNYLAVAKGQLDLIENSFQLIADQIVTMQSPAELSGQLDDLLDGVESIQQTAIDTDKILNTLEA